MHKFFYQIGQDKVAENESTCRGAHSQIVPLLVCIILVPVVDFEFKS